MHLMQVAQRAVDLDRAAAFYSALLDSRPTARFDPPGLVFFELDGTRLLLSRGSSSALLYLRVHDVYATMDALRERGVTIETDPHTIYVHQDDTLGPAGHDEVQAFIRDTEGNLVGLIGFVPS